MAAVPTAGDIGPLHITAVNPGRAGAVAEIVFSDKTALLTYSLAHKATATLAQANNQLVMGKVKRSSSGNHYLEDLRRDELPEAVQKDAPF